MKLKIKDLAKEVKISASRLRVLLCKPEFSCFTSYSKNELGRPSMVFDLNDTSKKMLLRYRRGYIPAENDNTEKYLAGEITTDAGYMKELSDSAVPYILKLAKSRTPLGNEARKELASRYNKYFYVYNDEQDLSVDYQEYNYSKQNAKTLLQNNRKELDFKNADDVYKW